MTTLSDWVRIGSHCRLFVLHGRSLDPLSPLYCQILLSVCRLALARASRCWRITCRSTVIISEVGAGSALDWNNAPPLSSKDFLFQLWSHTVTDPPPRCHGNVTVLSTVSKLQWFIDLSLARLGSEREKNLLPMAENQLHYEEMKRESWQ